MSEQEQMIVETHEQALILGWIFIIQHLPHYKFNDVENDLIDKLTRLVKPARSAAFPIELNRDEVGHLKLNAQKFSSLTQNEIVRIIEAGELSTQDVVDLHTALELLIKEKDQKDEIHKLWKEINPSVYDMYEMIASKTALANQQALRLVEQEKEIQRLQKLEDVMKLFKLNGATDILYWLDEAGIEL
ncbi:hypothetical protein [Paenibacillus periandrae]|uniref:hypothetical protein n=1 Tax=Paenibacillus periandrae TaxID=1761741 RepID=UPI001F099343|nr:hypothetical protein [Paenibacillus periandrae]